MKIANELAPLRKEWKYILLGFVIFSLAILPVVFHEIESLRDGMRTLNRELESEKKRTQALEQLIETLQKEVDSLRGGESVNTTTKLKPSILGRGVFSIGESDHWNQPGDLKVASNPRVAGGKIMRFWSDLEPKEGEYNWKSLDNVIEAWAQAGKKVIISVMTAAWSTDPATPDWVIQAGAKVIEGKYRHPVYWDPVFLYKYGEFVRAFGERYDDNPNVEMIQIGVGVWGETICSAVLWGGSWSQESPGELGKWTEAGLTPEKWVFAVKKIIDMYRNAFKKTVLSLMVANPGPSLLDYSDEYASYAAERKILLQYNGMGKDVWKPILDILSKHLPETSIGLESYGPSLYTVASWGPAEWDKERTYTIMDHVNIALTNNASYLTIWYQDLLKATKGNQNYDATWEEALRRASENLKEETSTFGRR